MILSGSKITECVCNGKIIIEPFEPSNVGSNSYDFRLGNRCKVYTEHCLDAALDNPVEEIIVDECGISLLPGQLYLFNTAERMGSTEYVPIIRGRSSTGRMGLFIDVTADLIDLGSINQWTLQLAPVLPIKVYPGMVIGQVTFWAVQGEKVQYSGKYGNQRSPVASLMYKDLTITEKSNAA